jgi:hypothetical protein
MLALPLALVAVVAPAAPATPVTVAPPLSARVASCQVGPDLGDRSAAFTASMPALPGTRRMAVRFDLLQRTAPTAAFAPVAVPGLGTWQRSLPGKPGFVFTQRVQALAAPAAYRAVVRFRWYARGGRVIRSARRETRVCRQPEMRPDLRAGLLTTAPGPGPGAVTYQLAVRNDGRSPAGPFDVALAVDGAPQPAQRVAGVPAHERALVSFVAPACASGGTLRFVLDAAAEVSEAVEADDVVERPCPVAG